MELTHNREDNANTAQKEETTVFKKSKRYVTLDFLRGISIFGMLIIHLLIHIWDRTWLNDLASAPIFAVLFMIILVYLGGWRGLFVMISGTGNMISMQKAMRKGVPWYNVVKKQLIGGILLLLFAALSETFLNYDGWIGQGILTGNWDAEHYLYRTFSQHTIHAVAWCLIINAILYGILVGVFGYKRVHVLAIIYGLLAITVIACTDLLWEWRSAVYIAQGLSNGEWYQHGFKHAILCILLNPIGGSPEPIFPFLSVLFIGNILGLYLAEDKPPKFLPRIGTIIGILFFIVGVVLGIALGADFESWLPLNNPERLTKIPIWQPWFFFCTGGQIIVVMVMFRFIEYRGRASAFAQRTKYFRRFGIIPFSVYSLQWFELLPRYLVGLMFSINVMQGAQVNTYITGLTLLLNLSMWVLIFFLWEKIRYIGSLEWIMGQINLGINKLFSFRKRKIMKSSKLDMRSLVHDVEWMNLSCLLEDERHERRKERYLLLNSILSIFLFPFILTSAFLLHDTKIIKNWKDNSMRNKISGCIALFGIILFISSSIILIVMRGLPISL